MNIDIKILSKILANRIQGNLEQSAQLKMLQPGNHNSGDLFYTFNCSDIKWQCSLQHRVFITSLFVLGKDWRQPNFPTIKASVNKLLYIHTVEYCVAIQKWIMKICMNWYKRFLRNIVKLKNQSKEQRTVFTVCWLLFKNVKKLKNSIHSYLYKYWETSEITKIFCVGKHVKRWVIITDRRKIFYWTSLLYRVLIFWTMELLYTIKAK